MLKRFFKRLRERIARKRYNMRREYALLLAYNHFLMSIEDGDRVSYPYGICYHVATALNRVFHDYDPKQDNLVYVQKHLPHYTYMNAALHAGANGDPEGLWWRADDVQHRLEFLDWLINNLE